MKTLFAIILLSFVAPANAEEASCTHTYNQYSRTVVKTCRGNLPVQNLPPQERAALIAGRVSSCVIAVELDPATKNGRVIPAVCK